MHISKHNYAIELERQGNRVYFMNPPNQRQEIEDYQLTKIESYNALFVIDSFLFNNRLIDFLRLRLKFTQIYDRYLFKLVKRICKQQNIQLEQVWSFDPNLHGFLYKYPARKRIFFIADAVQNNSQRRAAKNADLVVSVAEGILEPFRKMNPRCLLINHGLNRSYENFAVKKLEALKLQKSEDYENFNRVQVGYIGNLMIPYLCHQELKRVVVDNPGIDFHFWGAYSSKENNLMATYDQVIHDSIQYIRGNCTNAYFYGIRESDEIINDLEKIDAFIYINNSMKDINGGANSHKILEYLSTGKVIISTYLSFYKDLNLLNMIPKEDEKNYPVFFNEIITALSVHNTKDKMISRIRYALSNTYGMNIESIMLAASKN